MVVPPSDRPIAAPSNAPTVASGNGASTPKADQEYAVLQYRAGLCRGDQAHLQQEQRKHTPKEIKEQRLERRQSHRAGNPADQQATDEQYDALAEKRLMRHLAPGEIRIVLAGENNADNNRGHFEQHQEQRELRIHEHLAAGEIGDAHDKVPIGSQSSDDRQEQGSEIPRASRFSRR